MQGLPSEAISKTKILDVVSAMRSSENSNKEKVEDWLLSAVCDVGFHHKRQILSMLL
jgi:hypothetical protein